MPVDKQAMREQAEAFLPANPNAVIVLLDELAAAETARDFNEQRWREATNLDTRDAEVMEANRTVRARDATIAELRGIVETVADMKRRKPRAAEWVALLARIDAALVGKERG